MLDMEQLILDMMGWANVSGKDLCEKGEHWFHTDEQLSYLNEWMRSELR